MGRHRFIAATTRKMTTITKPITTDWTASNLTAPYMLIPVITPIKNAITAMTITLDVDIIVTPV